MSKRPLVHSEEEAWTFFKTASDALFSLGYSPRLVFFLIDPVQTGFAKICGTATNLGAIEAMFWDSYEEANKYLTLMNLTGYNFEVRATLLVEDGVAIISKGEQS